MATDVLKLHTKLTRRTRNHISPCEDDVCGNCRVSAAAARVWLATEPLVEIRQTDHDVGSIEEVERTAVVTLFSCVVCDSLSSSSENLKRFLSGNRPVLCNNRGK